MIRAQSIRWFVCISASLMIGCGEAERNEPAAVPDDPGASAAEGSPTILFVGTSLTAGLGVAPDEAFPAIIQEKIDSAGLPHRVVNAGVSGETSAGALRRIDWLLRQPFDVFVLETGANDMLRGTNLDSTRYNIQLIIDRVRAARPDAEIVLIGMYAPPNFGARYTTEFREIYPEIAHVNAIELVPFLLEDVGGITTLNQADGIHPTAEGHEIMAATVWATLGPVLDARSPSPTERAPQEH